MVFRKVVVALAMLAGYRKDAIEQAPRGLAQAVTLGMIMPLLAMLSGIWAGYAVARVFYGEPNAFAIAILGGTIWALVVVLLDRLLVLGLDKFQPAWRQVLGIVVRLPFAVVIAAIVAEPIVLRVASTVFDRELRSEQRAQMVREQAENAKLADVDSHRNEVKSLENRNEDQDKRLQSEPDSFRFRSARSATAAAEARLRSISTTNVPRIARAQAEAGVLRADPLIDERGRARLRDLQNSISAWDRQVRRAQVDLATARNEQGAAHADWLSTETAQAAEISAQLQAATAAEAAVLTRVGQQNAETNQIAARLHAPDLINQYRLMRRIAADPAHPDSWTIRSFEYGINLAFALLEVLVISLKTFSRKTPLDYAMQAVELMDRERSTVRANLEIEHIQRLAEAQQDLHEKTMTALRVAMGQRINTAAGDVQELKRILKQIEDLTPA